jgi:hypothetical protein
MRRGSTAQRLRGLVQPHADGRAAGEVEIGSRLVPLAWGHGLALEGGEL